MFFQSLAALALAASASAAIINVDVGNSTGGLIFNPEAINAMPGDQVIYTFHQKNHSVTQSSFASPCAPLDGGLDSGFMPVAANVTDGFPTFTVTVNDTKPIWIFCDQAANTAASHCGAGMVHAINCGPDGSANSFSGFKAAALAVGAQLQAAAAAASTTTAPPPAETTADYGTATIPAAPVESTVTVTVTVETSSWVTTYASYPGSPAATPASLTGNVHTVVVGNANGSLIFDPPFLTDIPPRDTISFEFHQKNHSVTQSNFAAPCLKAGLDSGFMAVADNATEFPTFNVTVNQTAPLWFYCRQHTPAGASHCGAGMVFAVNPVQSSPRNFSAFQALAAQLNGTNTTGAVSSPSTTPSSPAGSGATSSMATNLALGLGSFFAAVAFLL
ncbi:hypothetical protein EUX98_g2172 [Antrodiella citrinella]|uniref:Phytocyanin domain-containing protein n=1 Tax=Antrodiella citrinella TaxID=2447956 RepID=A0A4S4N7X6_9APHY|nr:hypothetical protein EUX98_g2172 [Antrodiella citrinella]